MESFFKENPTLVIDFLLTLSVAFIILPVVYVTVRNIIQRRRISESNGAVIRGESTSRMLMKVSVCLVMAVFFQRFMVMLYGNMKEYSDLYAAEKIVEAFIRALKTFGIDDGCAEFINEGIGTVKTYFPDDKLRENVYRITASFLDIATPVAGGAVLFEILASVFPRIRLFFSRFREQYVFSQLNERSLALAKSLYIDKKRLLAPAIIFASAALDEDGENSSGLTFQAKNMGAVCVNEDINHLNFWRYNKKKIFFIDGEELSNIRALSAMAEEGELSAFNKMQIYAFYQDDSYALLEQRISLTIDSRFSKKYKTYEKKDGRKKKESNEVKENESFCDRLSAFISENIRRRAEKSKPIITRVRDYESIIYNLLEKVPLFEPLAVKALNAEKSSEGIVTTEADGTGIEKIKELDMSKDFNLTVFGTGHIGMQMILSSTWCGQFYGHKLNINVVSKEEKGDFVRQLNKISTEIIESTKEKSPLLAVYPDESRAYAKPYFRLRYKECDIENEIIDNIKCTDINTENESADDTFDIIGSDYFVIALGSDEANIALAEELKKRIERKQLVSKKKKNAVIAFSVFDHNLCSVFAVRRTEAKENIRLYAFGSIDETYDYKNITMVRKDPRAITTDNVYEKVDYEKSKSDYDARKRDPYKLMSSLSRSRHVKYRVYSAYTLLSELSGKELKDEWGVSDENFFTEKVFDKYLEEIIGVNVRKILSGKEDVSDVYNYLSWLEHRRWNAYMRSIGFVRGSKENGEKDVALRLHPCLVECDMGFADSDMLTMEDKKAEKNTEKDKQKQEGKPKRKDLHTLNYLFGELEEKKEETETEVERAVRKRNTLVGIKCYDEPPCSDEELIKTHKHKII